MAEVGHQPIVGDRRPSFSGARRLRHERRQRARLRASAGCRSGVRIQGRPSKEVGARGLEAACRGAGEGMPANKPQPRRQVRARRRTMARLVLPTSVTIALAAHARRQVVQQADVLPDRRREHDEVGSVRQREVVPSAVGGPRRSAVRRRPRAVDGDDVARRPRLTQRQRDRSANQPEADDGDAVKHAMLSAEC